MIDKNKVGYHNSSSAFDLSEVSRSGVNRIERISADVKY